MDQSRFQFDRDHLFERESSPFMPEQLLHFRRADLFERVTIQRLEAIVAGSAPCSADVMDGALLLSAVLFGALLDRRLWQEWVSRSYGLILPIGSAPPANWRSFLAAVQGRVEGQEPEVNTESLPHLFSGGRLWIDCTVSPEDAKPETKRWVADPLTHCLLGHWQKIRGMANRPLPEPEAVISEFFGAGHWDMERKEWLATALYDAAVAKWRLRMPGFLVDALGEQGVSVSLPLSRWNALLGLPTTEARFSRSEPRLKRISRDPARSIIQSALPAGRASPHRMFVDGAAAIADASRDNRWVSVDRLVLQWAADRMNPARDGRQRTRGLAPSTLDERSGFLLRGLRAAFGERDPSLLPQAELVLMIDGLLSGAKRGSKQREHLKCFFDWLQRRYPSQSIAIASEARRRSGVDAALVTTAEYRRILDRHDPATERGGAVRIATMLAFRAGLRWIEIDGLAVCDLTWTDDTIEMSVHDNPHRRTKSLAGRRLIPLHLLLDAGEAAELRRWWHSKGSASRLMPARRDDGAHDTRLVARGTEEEVATFKRVLDHAVREATGEHACNFHTLRHSFGSYLLATLSLPCDVTDQALVPRIDPSLVSHRRRSAIAGALWGDARLGQNAVHVTSALMGHSGNHSTIRSYMHLTDWLAAVYVARPTAQRGLPAKLAATLLGKSVAAVERSDRRRVARAIGAGSPYADRRPRGRPEKAAEVNGSIYLAPFVDAEAPRPFDGTHGHSIRPTARHAHAPRWQSLLAVIAANSLETRRVALDHPDIDTTFGKKVVAELDALILMETRGRDGTKRRRHMDHRSITRTRAPRRLEPEQLDLLERLYRGAAQLDPERCSLLVQAFLHGYDRPRGVIRVPGQAIEPLLETLRACGCAEDELTVNRMPMSATVRVGLSNRTGRGFRWAMLMIAAVHRVSCSGKTG